MYNVCDCLGRSYRMFAVASKIDQELCVRILSGEHFGDFEGNSCLPTSQESDNSDYFCTCTFSANYFIDFLFAADKVTRRWWQLMQAVNAAILLLHIYF